MNAARLGIASAAMYPDIMRTAVLGQILVILLTSSGPHIPGMMTSDTTRSKHGMA